ncbi:MAG: PAS domain-containing protein [Alphaproteobacteria bacterium]|nr:PAS domain-containing protein [Alphaproteobacteria bacterium]
MATSVQLAPSIASPNEVNILGALAFPILVIGADNQINYVNGATEQFLGQGKSSLRSSSLADVFVKHSPIYSLVEQVRSGSISVFEHDLDLSRARGGSRPVSVQASPLLDEPGAVVLSFHSHGAARSMERQLVHRGAARSVSAMASMLAHEVKNPLSGIRGAAQLLERAVSVEDQSLAQLIKEEADRICKLVDRMGVFGDDGPPDRETVNIHEVLDRVNQLASAEFADNVKILTDYDPSLPPVLANKDQLIQVFLNLVKNAVEAMPDQKGEIKLATGFRRGVRLTVPGSHERVHLPLMISVADNGNGIPSDIAQNIFDPFVTTKSGGTGLGLALVAKLVHDHGGIIEFETDDEGTNFRLYFPMLEVSHTAAVPK